MNVAVRRALLARRDQGVSAFAGILADLVERVPGARAAALVDADGETVDYASRTNPFDVRLAAAHWMIVLREAQGAFGEACVLSIRASRRSFIVRALPQGYALVVVLSCGVSTASGGRAFPLCVLRLAGEAGWPQPNAPTWHPVDVRSDDRGRPTEVRRGNADGRVEILGAIVGGLARFERGWRIRCGAAEATIIREPSGHWYADEPMDGPVRSG